MTDPVTDAGHAQQAAEPLALRSNAGLGVCVMARGTVVAWFASFTDEARDWCTENYFGEWLTWRAAAPVPIPLTAAEEVEVSQRAADLLEALRVE